MSPTRQPSCRLPFSLHRRPPQRRALSTAIACAMVCLLPAVCTPVLAQTVTVERQTIDQLRATTMALIDALDRQTQQSRAQQEQMARQAIDQQRLTTLALIEVLASQGLLSREKAETLARLSTPQGLVTAPQAGYAPQAYAAPVAAAAPFAPASAQQPAYAPPVQQQQPFAAAQAAPAPRQPAQQGLPQAGSPLAAAAASLPLAAAAIAAQGAAAAAAASPYAAPPVVQGPVPTSAQALAAAQGAQAAQRQPAWGDPPLPAGTPPASNTVRVPYISESLKAQLRADIRNDVLAVAREERWADPRLLPDWVRSLSLHGDLRVRGQYEHLPKTNLPAFDYRAQTSSPAWSPDLANTQLDRTRMTLRARLAVDAKAGDNFEAGLRLSTGTTSGPTSSSQTLGTGFNKSTVVLDRAFIKWEPIQDLRLLAGRFGNPFFSSDLIWPDDIGFDGVAVQAERTITSGVYAFATVGAFPLEDFNVDSRDKWLYGAQIGVDWALGNRTQWRTGLALYDFHNVQGVRENAPPPSGARAGTVPYFNSQYLASIRLKGNTLINLNDPSSTTAPTWGLASKFRPINFSTVLTLKHFDPLDIAFGLDWVKNSAFDTTDISQRAGVALGDGLRNRSTGLQARLAVGKARLGEKGDWQLTTALRHFERDAWLDGFTDTTWNLGGTSYRGWSIAGQYALDRRTSLGLRVTSTRNLDDGYRAPVTGEATKSSAPLRIDVMQVDLNARF